MKHKWALASMLVLCWLAVSWAQDDRPQRAGAGAGGRLKEGVLRLRLQDGYFEEDDDDDGTGDVIRIVQAPDLSGGPPSTEEPEEAVEETDSSVEPEQPTEPPRELSPEEIKGSKIWNISYK